MDRELRAQPMASRELYFSISYILLQIILTLIQIVCRSTYTQLCMILHTRLLLEFLASGNQKVGVMTPPHAKEIPGIIICPTVWCLIYKHVWTFPNGNNKRLRIICHRKFIKITGSSPP